MTENTKDDPIPLEWAEEPTVERVSHWVEDDDQTYPKQFIEMNGTLYTMDQAREARDKLTALLAEERRKGGE